MEYHKFMRRSRTILIIDNNAKIHPKTNKKVHLKKNINSRIAHKSLNPFYKTISCDPRLSHRTNN